MRPAGAPPAGRVPAIVVHGGADPADGRDELRAGMRAAVAAGWRLLAEGGRAVDAVEAAVRALEDHPRFNAGRGAVLTSAGTGVANPVTLARRVLDDGRHVLLAGAGALDFARVTGVPECDPASLITERQRRRHAERRAADAGGRGTVGAVALDRHGTIAAATSTGGVAGKLPGRVGDSAWASAARGWLGSIEAGGVRCRVAGTGPRPLPPAPVRRPRFRVGADS